MAADQAPSHVLVMQFVAALLQRTLGCPTVEAHQQALQGVLDDLTPWISPADLPTLLAQPGAEHDLPSRRQGHRDVFVVAARGEREVVKEGERLLQKRRELHRADPGRQVVQEAL